jgi:virulence factor Mce-like protein
LLERLLQGSTHVVVARLSALLLAALLLGAVGGYSVVHFGLFDRGPEYEAEFLDAWPLVAGMDVRVSGAVAGSVRKVALTKRGTAVVTFQLDPRVPQPRADARVAIRQDDLLGDTDLSLSLGTATSPLRTPIPVRRSIQEPRLDDFLNIFRAPVRVALKAFLVELGTALENRGVDVNAAILQLRPGFEALGDVFNELQSQLDALRHVLENSHALTRQLASRTADLDRLVSGLEQTLTGVAANGAQLDAGLAQLPAALAAARTTLGRVQTLANQVRPLATTVAEGAPGFQRAANLIGPYASALSTAAKLASPTIRLAGEALRHGAPALDALRKTSFADLLNPTAGLFNALAPVLGRLADGLFGSTNGGGLGGVVVPGNDLLAPNVDPARNYLSAYLVISCEMFGLPQGPGCLTKALQAHGSAPPQHGTSAPAPGPRRAAPGSLKPLLGYLLRP